MSVVLAAVMPTRNRASLAIQGIQSVLAQKGAEVRLLVSDNSSRTEEVERLASFCAQRTDGRLVYLRAPESMPMGTHWNWAIRQAVRAFDPTHVTVHYDRRISRAGELALLSRIASKHPDLVITHRWDAIVKFEDRRRYQAILSEGDRGLYEIDSERVLAAMASGRIGNLPVAVPLLNNCVVPRSVLDHITRRFGDVCDSVAADVSFTFRFLGMYDRYLYLSRGIGVLHAFHRSHAAGFLTGNDSDLSDLRRLWGDRPWLDAAPIAGLTVGQNMLFHEYVLAQRVFGEQRYPPIDREGYLRELASAVPMVADPVRREEIRTTLEQHGWREDAVARVSRVRRIARVVRAGLHWLRHATAVRMGITTTVAGRPFASEVEALEAAVSDRGPRRRKCSVMVRLDARKIGGE